MPISRRSTAIDGKCATPTVSGRSEFARTTINSKAPVQKALAGKITGVPQLAHLSMGRRKLVRKEWLEHWMETGKTR